MTQENPIPTGRFERTCANCGESFMTNLPQQIYCGSECQRQAKRTRRLGQVVDWPDDSRMLAVGMVGLILGMFLGMAVGGWVAGGVETVLGWLGIERQVGTIGAVLGGVGGAIVGARERKLVETLGWTVMGIIVGAFVGTFLSTVLTVLGLILGTRTGWQWIIANEKPLHILRARLFRRASFGPSALERPPNGEIKTLQQALDLALERASDGAAFGAGLGVIIWTYLGWVHQLMTGAVFGALVGMAVGGAAGTVVAVVRLARHGD